MNIQKDTSTIETICKKIDKNILLVNDRGLLAQNIVESLRHLVEAVCVFIYNVDKGADLKVEYIDNSIKMATDYIDSRGTYKFLSEFYRGVQVSVSHYVPNEEEAVRLMQKHFYSLVNLKKLLENKFGLKVLKHIYDYPINMDSTFHDYYSKIIPLIDQCSEELGHMINGRYYVQNVKPILWGKRLYYEVTLSPANDNTSKFDRIIVFSHNRVTTNYAIKAEIINMYTEIYGKNMLVRVLTDWQVSIRPCEINNYAKIFGLRYQISGIYKEYQALMQLLTEKEIDLLDICTKDDPEIQIAYDAIDSTYLRPLLDKSKEIIRNKQSGSNILRYLLFTMRNKVIKGQLWYHPQKELSNLYLNIKCNRFDKVPFVMGLANHVPTIDDVLRCIETSDRSDELLARRIISNSEKLGSIYTSANDITLDEGEELRSLIDRYNRKQYRTHQGSHLVEEGKQIYIRSYEKDCISIIENLNRLAEDSEEGYSAFAEKWLEINNPDISDDKKDVLKNLFSNSRVALLYGAAGTGKTTLIEAVSKMYEGSRILYLASTYNALNNIKRRTVGDNHTYETISKCAKSKYHNYYDILVIDECSATSNNDIAKILKYDVFDKVLLVGDIYQLESINFGNWFMLARELMNKDVSFELKFTHRTKNDELLKLWNLVRNADNKVTDFMSKNAFNYPINKELLTSYDKDEIILCLAYNGLFGINNINCIMQSKNPGKTIDIGISRYKVNDPIVFNESKIYGDVLYNNLKGRLTDIKEFEDRVYFEIELETIVDSTNIENAGVVYVRDDGEKSIIGLYVNKIVDTDDDDRDEMVVPFSVAYAMSVYKAQGLEYNSVKIIIPNDLEEIVTPNLFYTAITRSRESLRIYWSPGTQQKILEQLNFSPDNKTLSILRNKLNNK